MSHSSPLLACGPGRNLLSSSSGFLLLVGWGLVEQSSLKGNQFVGGRKKDTGGTQLFLGLEEFKEEPKGLGQAGGRLARPWLQIST